MPITVGSKLQVWKGEAQKTGGGLKKDDLMKNKRGKVVSKKKHAHGLKMYESNNLQRFKRDKAGMAELRSMRKRKSVAE